MDGAQPQTFTFEAEVGKLLDIVAHALYSQKEIFLRELISNASDACDKLRYRALTEPGLISGEGDFRIEIAIDTKAKALTVADNGIGMSHDDMVDALGTIARSGTQAFVENLAQSQNQTQSKDDKDKGVALIGQFGVGFYSSFMVADRVEVVSRAAGADEAWRWSSDGQGAFTMEPAERDSHGTDVIVHLKKDQKEYLEGERIGHIVRTYSDHIGIPVVLRPIKKDDEEKTLNDASALWTRAKKDITEDQYKEFYHHVAHAFDDPWLTIHNSVEGVLSYTNLLYIPSMRPFDLFHPERKGQVKLYVKRVFITDDTEALLPGYLRFVRGVVDSEDIDLNVSREMLQHNPAVAKIRKGLVNRVLGELKKKADKKPEDYAVFWDAFGAVLKEGLYEDQANRDKLLGLARFRSTAVDGLTSLADYVERMKDGQEAIYTITGDDAESLANSPHLEGFRAKGIEVLYLTDPVDEFWMPQIGTFEEKPFKSATRGGADLDKVGGEDGAKDGGEATDETKKPETEGFEVLVGAFKATLGDAVKDVRASDRLTSSAVCLIADEGDMDVHLQRLLKQHNQLDSMTPRILELNPTHDLVVRLSKLAQDKAGKDPVLEDAAYLMLDQARIVEGEVPADPAAFAKRMAAVMAKALG